MEAIYLFIRMINDSSWTPVILSYWTPSCTLYLTHICITDVF